jgi:hypothetical protein
MTDVAPQLDMMGFRGVYEARTGLILLFRFSAAGLMGFCGVYEARIGRILLFRFRFRAMETASFTPPLVVENTTESTPPRLYRSGHHNDDLCGIPFEPFAG